MKTIINRIGTKQRYLPIPSNMKHINRLNHSANYSHTSINKQGYPMHMLARTTIGTTMTITDKVTPNLVGVDIGCGMLTTKLNEKKVDRPNSIEL